MKRGTELDAFLAHVRQCAECRPLPRVLCPEGYRLFETGAHELSQKLDPKRAQA
jgi:hypothetical protein